MTDNRLLELEDRLEELVNAHRELAARHEGLLCVSRLMFMLIPADKPLLQRLSLTAYDVLNERMDKKGYDDEFQTIARNEVDALFSRILGNA